MRNGEADAVFAAANCLRPQGDALSGALMFVGLKGVYPVFSPLPQHGWAR